LISFPQRVGLVQRVEGGIDTSASLGAWDAARDEAGGGVRLSCGGRSPGRAVRRLTDNIVDAGGRRFFFRCARTMVFLPLLRVNTEAAIFGLYVMHYPNKFKKCEGGIGGSMGDVPTINLV
jgi:hypothetical protein